jgi:hypothetical protein
MTTNVPDNIYLEEIPMPWGLRAIFYGSVLAMLAGLLAPTFFPDEDINGATAWIYYAGMTFGLVAMFFAAVWFRKLIVWVDSTYLAFGYGKFRKRFTFDQIQSVESIPYSYSKYGGAGIRYAKGGHRAWSVPFVHTGVEVKLVEGGKDRTYYISSRRADELESVISANLLESQHSD